MSHKFSFLQAFAGYSSWQCKLLSTCRQKNWSNSLSAGFRIECNRLVPSIKLLANTSKSGTHICHVAGFSQIAPDFSVLMDADSAYRYYRFVADVFSHVKSEYISRYNIRHLKKYLLQSWLGCDFGQCKYLLQYVDFASINHFSFRKEYWFVADLPSTHCNIYQSFRFSKNCN